MFTVTFAASAALAFVAPANPARADQPAAPLYVLESEARLPSSDTSWDYMKLEGGTPRLYMARRNDGLTLFDVRTMQAVRTVEDSVGANGPVLIPKIGRGYVAMTDGSLLVIDLKTGARLSRTPLASDGGLNSGVLEPTTGRLHMITGSRPKETTWFAIRPETGAVVSRKAFPFRKMDDPAYDAAGYLYAPARHDNLILKLKASDLSEVGRFALEGCVQPTKVAFHRPAGRLIVACRGDRPVMQVIDPADGRLVLSLPIAAGVDGIAIDDTRGRIVTSGDAALSVIGYAGDDSYRPLGEVTTRPGAKIMAMDKATGAIFVVAADKTRLAPADGGDSDTIYHANSFTVLRYGPR